MRRFFSFRSSTANAGNGKGGPCHDERNEKISEEDENNGKSLEEDENTCSSLSPETLTFRLRSRPGELKNEESSNPQLRRCLSFSSPATNRWLEERRLSFSGDLPCSMSNSSDAPHHAGDVDCYAWSPERHPVMGEYMIKVPKSHGIQETDSPRSRCYSCSTGHSPVSSPVALRCRPARLNHLLDKNEVLDLYIDKEQEAMRLNEKHKQKCPIRSSVSYLGRPPRPHSTVPTSPKFTKEILENYSDPDVKVAYLHPLAQEGARELSKVASLCNVNGNHASIFDASLEKLSHLEECKSESLTAVEDIYEDLQDVQPPCFFGPSVGSFSEEQDTDEKLLRRAKEVEMRFIVPSGDNCELNMLRDKRLSSTDVFELIESLTEDRKQLALELSSQIKARLAEGFAAKAQYKQSKIELDTRTRRLEKEKAEVQTTLERELDRRSNDWSLKLVRFQSEEQRLRERVRELAEQNVAFQREVTLLESNRVDASNRMTSLEVQNNRLNDELQKVRNDHDNLHSSSIELQSHFTKVAEERDNIQGGLRDKEHENLALHKVIAKLQRICNEQEKTIAGLRQGCKAELEKKIVGSSESNSRMQMELIRLTGVEQKLRREIHSCTLEVESLRHENIAILNRLQSSENRLSVSSIRLDQELHARVDSLQTQGLSLLDNTSQLCAKLLELIKCKRHENESICDIDALAAMDCTLKYQSSKGGIESLKQSLRTIKSVLAEKYNEIENAGESTGGGSLSGQQKDKLPVDDFELKLKEEVMLNRVLKEKLLSKELDIEQLLSDLASSVRIQDVMQNEIQRVQDELSCLTNKSKHLQLLVLKKEENINQIQQDLQESANELTALRGTLKTVTDERNLLWQEAKQLRKTISALQNDVALLKQKIKSLDEDILLKEGEILLREGEISILRDSVDKPFDIICSPRSMKQFVME